jgi:hypothetical protein
MGHLSGEPLLGKLQALPAAMLKRLDRVKHSSLFYHFVSSKEKKFCNIDTWAQCYKTFYDRSYEFS